MIKAHSNDRQQISNTLALVETVDDVVMKNRKEKKDFAIDFSTLAQLRSQHESKQAKKGIRKVKELEDSDASVADLVPDESLQVNMQAQLMKQFKTILEQDEQDRAIGMGAARQLRWTGNVLNPGYTSSQKDGLSGNSANAKEVASANAKRVHI